MVIGVYRASMQGSRPQGNQLQNTFKLHVRSTEDERTSRLPLHHRLLTVVAGISTDNCWMGFESDEPRQYNL